MNMTHIQITSDHGFIYQHDEVDIVISSMRRFKAKLKRVGDTHR